MTQTIDTPSTAKKSDKGFTLVELLIVIVVLGILATITVFAVSGVTTKAKASACSADTSALNTAIESYNAGEGGYPASLAALSTAAPAVAGVSAGGTIYLKTAIPNAATRFTYVASSGTLTPTSTC